MKLSATFVILMCALMGCAARAPQAQPTTRPAVAMDPATTQPAFWLEQPDVAVARHDDFERLFAAAEDAARGFFFDLDRSDWRAGVLTTRPMVSAQFFELWRRDAQTWDDVSESSTATIRRTVRFEFDRLDDATFQVTPKVLVERQALAEQRITSVVLYRSAFGRAGRPADRPRGTRESDVGIFLPTRYWYPTGRDQTLEKALVDEIQKNLARAQRAGQRAAGGSD